MKNRALYNSSVRFIGQVKGYTEVMKAKGVDKMKKILALSVKYGGVGVLLLGAGSSDGGASFVAVLLLAVFGLLMMLGGSFASWKCAHPSRRPSVVRFCPPAVAQPAAADTRQQPAAAMLRVS